MAREGDGIPMRVTGKELAELRGPVLTPEQNALLDACCAFIELAEPAEVAFLNTALRYYGRQINEADHAGIDAVTEAVAHAALVYRQARAKERAA
jgi:hypothetical protein